MMKLYKDQREKPCLSTFKYGLWCYKNFDSLITKTLSFIITLIKNLNERLNHLLDLIHDFGYLHS